MPPVVILLVFNSLSTLGGHSLRKAAAQTYPRISSDFSFETKEPNDLIIGPNSLELSPILSILPSILAIPVPT